MAGELSLERHGKLFVGELVQKVADGPNSAEGELIAISRETTKKRFRYTVRWTDGSVEQHIDPVRIQRTHYADFPDLDDARDRVWSPGDRHYWVMLKWSQLPNPSCLFCGRIRSVIAERVRSECTGPVKIGLR